MIATLTHTDTYITQSNDIKEVKLRSSNGTTFSIKEENGNLVITNN